MAPILENYGHIDIFHQLMDSFEHQFQSVLLIVLCSVHRPTLVLVPCLVQ